MLSHTRVGAAVVLVALAAAGGLCQPQRATIADVAWMQGAWAMVDGSRTVEEQWTTPAGGVMLGVSRTVVDGALTEFEFLRIVERAGGLVYIAQPNGRPPTDFGMTRLDNHSVTFENPQHDYPRVIRYEKRSDTTIVASISGAAGDRTKSWTYARRQPLNQLLQR